MMEQRSQYSKSKQSNNLGKILLMSSGETSASGRKMHERMLTDLGLPVRVAVLETPAGFELNSALVAQKVGDFLNKRLRNFSPDVSIIAARNKDGPFSTNNPDILAPMLDANYFFLGAGSPTYLAHHLKDSLGLSYLLGRHRMGATLCLASASAIAVSSKAMPVYEIFKAGHELHWIDGLDLFGPFGLDLAIISHWDNGEGGADLDTRYCFMGQSRMDQLRRLLPTSTVILGIDEHTGVLFNFQDQQCHILGKGKATVLGPQLREVYEAGRAFPIENLGSYHIPADLPQHGSPILAKEESGHTYVSPPEEVADLLKKRDSARQANNWAEADNIRSQIVSMGFEVYDTPEGPQVVKV